MTTSYGFKFYNASGEVVIDDNYIKPWFAGKAVPYEVTGPTNGYNNDKYYQINYNTPSIGGLVNFIAITLPDNGGEYFPETNWSAGYAFSIGVYFPISYTPTSADAPEVYCFSVNPVNPRTTTGYGLQLRRANGDCTFDSNVLHFKPANAVNFTMPYRYATGSGFNMTTCGSGTLAECTQAITLTNVPSKAAFVLPWFAKSQAYTVYSQYSNISYLFEYQAVYKRISNTQINARVATRSWENMEGFYADYSLVQGGENQYIIYVDGSKYDYGGGTITFPTATYDLVASAAVVSEGTNITITLNTTGVSNGTYVPWIISGSNITSEDFNLGGVLTGSFEVQNNTAQVVIPVLYNSNSETKETATFALTNGLKSITFDILNVPYYTTPSISYFDYSPVSPNETGNRVVTFTIYVTDSTASGAPRDFYWALVGGANVTGDDFDGLIYGTLTTGNGQVTRTFSVTIKQDYLTEGTETFSIKFYMGAPYTGTLFYSSSDISIADTSKDRPVISYFEIKPNSTGTYGTTVTGISGETPYFRWSVSNSTSVSINNGIGTVNASGSDIALAGAVNTATTWTLTATNSYGSTTASVTFNTATASYSLTASASEINENASVTFTLTTTNVLNGSVIPFTVNSGTFDANDFLGGAISTNGSFTVNNNSATKTYTSVNDTRTDGNKTLTMTLVNYPTVSASCVIKDTSTCPPAGSYVITQCIGTTERNVYYTGNYDGTSCTTYNVDSPNSVFCGYNQYLVSSASTTVTEGNSITFTVTTANVASGSTVYWTNSGTTGTASGSVVVTTTSGIYCSGTITVNTTATNTFDGTRTVIVNIRGTQSINGQIVATSNTVNVVDAAASYSLTTSSTSITEGNSITYSLQANNITTPEPPVYWEHIGTATGSHISTTNGTIYYANGYYNLTINTNSDPVYNSPEKNIEIRFRNVNASGTILATSLVTTLTNAAPTYGISGPTSANETNAAILSYYITTTNVANGTTLYWDNTGTTVAADFTDNSNSGSFQITNNAYTLSRTLSRDQTYEGDENIVINIRTSSGGSAVATASTTIVSDTSQQEDWQISGPSSINEGTSAEYFVTGSQYVSTWGTTKVYLTLRHGTTNSSDVSIDFTNGRILSGDAGEAAFTVTTVADQTTEGSETFYLDLRQDSLSNGVITTKTVTITDSSVDPVYGNVQINSITWDPSSVNEGSCITFTVNATDNTTSGAPRNFYYASIGGYNTTGADFSGNGYGTLTSQNGTFNRTFQICFAADQTTEPNPSPETFSVGIYKDGPYTGTPYYQTTSININDTSQTPNPPSISYFDIKLAGGSYGGSAGYVSYSSNGYTAFFRWSVSNATSVTISGIGGDQGSYGNDAALASGVTTTTNWVLTASNAGGSVSAGVTLYICAAPGSWDGSSYVCSGANKYKSVTNGNCGTTTGDLLQANAYSDCCSQDTTTVLESVCIIDQSTPQRRKKYNNGQCGYTYTYTADNYCCPGAGTFLGWTTCSNCVQYPMYTGGRDTSNNTTCLVTTNYNDPSSCSMNGYYTGTTYCNSASNSCSGTIYELYQPANCGSPYYVDRGTACYPGSEKTISNSCSGATRTIVTCNGSGGTSSSSYTDYAGCCPGAGWSGTYQCVTTGNDYGNEQQWYNDGYCGGYWANTGNNCCLPYGTPLYSYCASSNVGNNNKVTVYSGGGSLYSCNNYTYTETNAPDCYVSPPPLTISCGASPSSVAIGGTTTLYWSTTGTCSGTTVEICALGGCTGVVYPCSGSQSGVGGGVTQPGYVTVTFTVSYGGYSTSCSTDVYFYVPSGGGGGGGGTQEN